jgi:hypothetical protein
MRGGNTITVSPSFRSLVLGFATPLAFISNNAYLFVMYFLLIRHRLLVFLGLGVWLWSVLTNPPYALCLIDFPVDSIWLLLLESNLMALKPLLLYDDAREDLESNGWLVFLRKFQGFNLQTAQEFALSFDGCRAKVGDSTRGYRGFLEPSYRTPCERSKVVQKCKGRRGSLESFLYISEDKRM